MTKQESSKDIKIRKAESLKKVKTREELLDYIIEHEGEEIYGREWISKILDLECDRIIKLILSK